MSQKDRLLKIKSLLNKRGQGFIEYALILALVVGIVIFVGNTTLKTGVNSVVKTAMNTAINSANGLGSSGSSR